jgi:hypothetical protein
MASTSTLLNPTLSLPPTAVYYLRKLIRQNLTHLQSVVAPGAGPSNDWVCDWAGDLNRVIENLYLDPEAINQTVQALEKLTLTHQALTTCGAQYAQEIYSAEKQIFWLLGFKYQPA